MSGGSIGTIVGGIVGGIIGFFAGGNVYAGAMLGMAVGGLVGGALDPPPKGPDITGPRLGDLTVQTSSYGAFIPRIYGTIAVYGNIFWLENNALKEVATKKKQGGKGMGGGSSPAQTTYAYFATFALGLCEGPIGGIARIWIGGKLFYDAGSSDISSIIVSNEIAQGFAIYTGSESQNADTRMQATLGVANTPAYRGLAYIVFLDLPLADYGNSLAATQIKVEVIKLSDLSPLAFVSEQTLQAGHGNFTNAPYRNDNGMYVWQIQDDWITSLTPTVNIYLFTATGINVLLKSFAITMPTTSPSHYDIPPGKSDQNIFVLPDRTAGNGGVVLVKENGSTLTIKSPAGNGGPTAYVIKNGYIYFATGSSSDIRITKASVDGGVEISVELPWLSSNVIEYIGTVGNELIVAAGRDSTSMSMFVAYDLESMVYLYEINKVAEYGSIISFDGDGDLFIYEKNATQLAYRTGMMGSETVMAASSQLSIFNRASWVYKHNIWLKEYLLFIWSSHHTSVYHAGSWTRNLIIEINPSLSTVILEECIKSNLLTSSDIDVTALTQTVRGYRISSIGAIRAAIEPLRGAYPFDVVQHGYKIKFVKRGGASIANITAAELDARQAGAANGISITNSREMDSQLPQKVTVKYFDYAREYDNGEQYAERINTEAINVRGIEIPVVLTADEAAQIATTLLYLYWMERYNISFKLPPEYNYLEPSDIITITTDNAVYILRLTSIAYTAKGFLECQAKYNKSAIYTQESKGSEGGPSGPGLAISGPSNYVLLDIPLIQDVYDMAGFPVAMTGYLPGWPGGIIYRSDDNGQTWADVQGFGKASSTIGYALTSLGTHAGTVLDKSGTLAVRMYNADVLSSVTEAQMFSGQNWFAYGDDQRWEIIAAQNCVLQGDGSYILSDFMRGQFGTEWASGLHAVNDKLVYLSSDELAFVLVNSSSIGVSKLYRGITAGKALDSDSDRAFSYKGVNLECLSPCALTGNRHPSTNDWTLTWTRRSRFVAWRDLIDSALGETTEAYEIDIFSSGTYATLKRTLTASTPTVAYSSAQQNTDFGSNQGTLYIKIYQLSSVVGRGYPLIAQIIR